MNDEPDHRALHHYAGLNYPDTRHGHRPRVPPAGAAHVLDMNHMPPTGDLRILPTGSTVSVTTPGPAPITLEFEPDHAAQIADHLDERALRLFADPEDTVTMYINAPHFQRLHIAHPAHIATTLRRAAHSAHTV